MGRCRWNTVSNGQVSRTEAGVKLRVLRIDEAQTDISARLVTKRDETTLFYDMTVVVHWSAEALKGGGQMNGIFKLYNVDQGTKFQPGGPAATSYMYCLGYDPQQGQSEFGGKAIAAANELFDDMAAAVDKAIEELANKST